VTSFYNPKIKEVYSQEFIVDKTKLVLERK